jgi:protein-arginine kinase activator protein McsA
MLHSFAIHEVQCREMFEKWESKKPPKERRKCPEDPMKGFHSNMSMKQLDALNAASHQTWTEQALVRCVNCNRTFLPEKLPIHRRSCTAANPARKVDDSVSTSQYGASDRSMSATLTQRQSTDRFASDSLPDDASLANCGNLVACRNCGRKFSGASYVKHARICAKVFTQKRKVFNSAKQRIQGTDLEAFYKQSVRRGTGSSTAAPRSSGAGAGTAGKGAGVGQGGVPKWKLDSMRFRAAMREARAVTKAQAQSKATGVPLHLLLPPPKASSGSGGGFGGCGGHGADDAGDGLRCPTCGRTFSQKAGERHIPQCKNIISKPTRLLKGSGAPSYTSPDSKASARGTFGDVARSTVGGFGDTGSAGRDSFGSAQEGNSRKSGLSSTTGRVSSRRPGSADARRGFTGSYDVTTIANKTSSAVRTGLSATVASGRGSGGISAAPVRFGGGFRPSAALPPASSRPSPRLLEPTASTRGTGDRAGKGGGGYSISQSNATSRDNPLIGRGRY